MTDADLYALCVYEEARGEPYEGKVAVARVIANRMAHRYTSDGTVAGTVLFPNQFSWAYFDMVGGRYTRVCSTEAEAMARADSLLPAAKEPAIWVQCCTATVDGAIGSAYAWGPEGEKLNAEPRAFLYCNPSISHPAWATPAAEVATIGQHTFYRD